MRLVMIISSLVAGGSERVLATLAGAMSERGYEVLVITDAPASSDHYSLDPNIRRIALNSPSDSNSIYHQIGRNFRRVKRLRRVIRQFSPDAAIAFGHTVNVRAIISSFGLGVPVIVSERTDPRCHTLPWPWRILRRLSYPLAASIVVQTKSVADWARDYISADRVRVIPNPVRPLQGRGGSREAVEQPKSVIAVGRLSREKGFDILLDAFSRAGLRSTAWQLVVIGEGAERPALRRQIEDLGLRGSVLMPGVVRDPERWLQHAQLFVLSSRFEGFPNALLEAMQCGVAVAAFDCPSGPREIVRHEQTGLLVPAGDVEALAAAIARLAADTGLRQRLGEAAATDVASRFSLEHITDLWEEALVGCLASAS